MQLGVYSYNKNAKLTHFRPIFHFYTPTPPPSPFLPSPSPPKKRRSKTKNFEELYKWKKIVKWFNALNDFKREAKDTKMTRIWIKIKILFEKIKEISSPVLVSFSLIIYFLFDYLIAWFLATFLWQFSSTPSTLSTFRLHLPFFAGSCSEITARFK